MPWGVLAGLKALRGSGRSEETEEFKAPQGVPEV